MKKSLLVLIVCNVFLLLEIIELAQSESDHIDEDSTIQQIDRENELLKTVLKNYDKKRKPSGQMEIKFALNLNQILKVRAKDQVFELNTFLDHEWIDPRLSWDPDQNYNISILRIPSEILWTPDTFVYTTADASGFLLPQKGAYFVVESSGKIFWPNPLPQMKVRCSMSIAWFPFDDQLCTIVFGSWTMTLNYLNYTLMHLDTALAGYQENSEWTLVDYKPFRYEITYDNWVEPFAFSEIHYKILIQRKPLYVLQNYCVPALMLCIIILISFYVPFPQESQMGISMMLTFAVIKLKLSDDVPAQSDHIPLFNVYYIGCMLISLLSLLWFSVANYYRTVGEKKLPFVAKYLTKKFICPIMRRKGYKIVISECGDDDKQQHHHDLTNLELIDIMNDFMFRIFCVYVILLNLLLLVILPFFIKTPMVITKD